MTPMIDRSMPRARGSLAIAAFALLANTAIARAQQPSDSPSPGSPDAQPAPASPEAAPAPATPPSIPAAPPADLSKGEPAPAALAATTGSAPTSLYTRA